MDITRHSDVPGKVVFSPAGVEEAHERRGLCELVVLELAGPQAVVDRLLTQVVHGNLRLRAHVLQLDLRRHVQSQQVDEHAQDVAQNLRGKTYHLQGKYK